MRAPVARPAAAWSEVVCVVCGRAFEVRTADLERGKRWVCDRRGDFACDRAEAAAGRAVGRYV